MYKSHIYLSTWEIIIFYFIFSSKMGEHTETENKAEPYSLAKQVENDALIDQTALLHVSAYVCNIQ